MLFAVITDLNSLDDLPSSIDGVEVRLDYLFQLDDDKLFAVTQTSSLKVLFTLRTDTQGGLFQGSPMSYKKNIQRYLRFKPDIIDIEYWVDDDFLNEIKASHPDVQILISYHHFGDNPPPVNIIVSELEKKNADIYKLIVEALSHEYVFDLLSLQKEKQNKWITFCIGRHGSWSRVVAHILGSYISYAFIDSYQFEGQISLHDWLCVYHYPLLNRETKIYGVVGSPLEQSPGHWFHNRVMQESGYNGVYIKMPAETKDLPILIAKMKEGLIKGLSVTIPFKEIIIPYIDSLDDKASLTQVVNTLVYEKESIKGYNTDIKGVEQALLAHLNDKSRFVLLGGGATAKSVLYVLSSHRKQIVCISRRSGKPHFNFHVEGAFLNTKDVYTLPFHDLVIDATSCQDHFLLSGLKNSQIWKVNIDQNNLYHRINDYLNKNLEERKRFIQQNTCHDGFILYLVQAHWQSKLWGIESSKNPC
ncbi:MAG: type I 3-dehydroquinate dehydratase [Rhabdochlamydiaceae bacterium]